MGELRKTIVGTEFSLREIGEPLSFTGDRMIRLPR